MVFPLSEFAKNSDQNACCDHSPRNEGAICRGLGNGGQLSYVASRLNVLDEIFSKLRYN